MLCRQRTLSSSWKLGPSNLHQAYRQPLYYQSTELQGVPPPTPVADERLRREHSPHFGGDQAEAHFSSNDV